MWGVIDRSEEKEYISMLCIVRHTYEVWNEKTELLHIYSYKL